MRYSKTLIKDPDMRINASSRLRCECGWTGTVRETPTLNVYNRAGELACRSYLCAKHLKKDELVILLEDLFSPPMDVNSQIEGEDKRKEN